MAGDEPRIAATAGCNRVLVLVGEAGETLAVLLAAYLQ
jgi:hypothetical protein